MSDSLQVRHRGGSASHSAGSIQQFQGDCIRLGRGPDCELRFDPHADLAVSTRHAEIRLMDGEASVLDTGSRNGVYVNGKRVDGSHRLQPGDLIRLGSDGPQFEVEFGSAAADDDVLQTIVRKPADDLRTVVNPSGGSPAEPPASAFPSPPPSARPAPPPDRQADPSPAPQAAPHQAAAKVPPELQGKQSIGVNTLMHVVERAAQRERARTRRLLVPIVGVLVAVVLALVFWPDSEPFRWADVLEKTKRSVYVCAVLDAGNASPNGTAWSIGEGRLATNAHVAELFEQMKPGQEFIVRSSAQPPVDLKIEKVTIHPGYREWTRLLELYNPFVPGQGFQNDAGGAYDVALLHVHPDDQDKLAESLPLASRDTILGIRDGDQMALVGYPMENQKGAGVNMLAPEPKTRAGTISRITNFWLGNDADEDSMLYEYSIQSAGGASGSPVINTEGEVIAVNNAGNYKFVETKEGVERIAAGGAYGQRLDVLLELIEGDAETHATTALEQEFQQRFAAGVSNPDQIASHFGGIWREKQRDPPHKTEVTVAVGSTESFDYELPAAGNYALVVVPLSRPIAPAAEVRLGTSSAALKAISYCAIFAQEKLPKATLTTRITVAADADTDEPLRYACYWFPID